MIKLLKDFIGAVESTFSTSPQMLEDLLELLEERLEIENNRLSDNLTAFDLEQAIEYVSSVINKKHSLLGSGELIAEAIRDSVIVDYLFENNYVKPLQLKFQQLVYTDEYGDLVLEAFYTEMRRLGESKHWEAKAHLKKYIDPRALAFFKSKSLLPIYLLDDPLNDEGVYSACSSVAQATPLDKEPLLDSLNSVTDPYQYEQLISSYIQSLGLSSRVTKGSGDQGADVVIEFEGTVCVVQCKLYSGTVGNKAVQEVSAAKGFYNAESAIVVTNSTFTKSAKQLAKSLSVQITHHTGLSDTLSNVFNLNLNEPNVDDSCSYVYNGDRLDKAIQSNDTQRLLDHLESTLKKLDFIYYRNENHFKFSGIDGFTDILLFCISSEEEEPFCDFLTFYDEMEKRDAFNCDIKILFTLNDVSTEIARKAKALDFELITDESIIDRISELQVPEDFYDDEL